MNLKTIYTTLKTLDESELQEVAQMVESLRRRKNQVVSLNDYFQLMVATFRDKLGVDIFDRCREKNFVNARIILGYTLYNGGFSKSSIARKMKLNHSTVVHYVNYMDYAVEHPRIFPELMEMYSAVKDTFEKILQYEKTI